MCLARGGLSRGKSRRGKTSDSIGSPGTTQRSSIVKLIFLNFFCFFLSTCITYYLQQYRFISFLTILTLHISNSMLLLRVAFLEFSSINFSGMNRISRIIGCGSLSGGPLSGVRRDRAVPGRYGRRPGRWTGRLPGRWTDRRPGRWAGRHLGRWAGRSQGRCTDPLVYVLGGREAARCLTDGRDLDGRCLYDTGMVTVVFQYQ